MVLPMQGLDLRPPSLLRARNVSGRMAVGGVLAAISAHVLVPGAIAAALALLSATGVGKTPHNVIVEEHVVEARFVKLGKKLDPHQIPSRKVPIKSTAPQPGVAVSKVMEPPKPNKPDAGPMPDNATQDLLTRLGDRAQTFAEIAQQQEQEGDPNGVADGTESTAQAGDLYAGQLRTFFQRGWTIPTTIADPSHLRATASIEITSALHVGPHRITKSSGDPSFDQSVEDRINQLQAQGTTLPAYPPELTDRYSRGWVQPIRFDGANAN
jgi:hypothetical protein